MIVIVINGIIIVFFLSLVSIKACDLDESN